jgi:ribosomal protein S18 acetylase RimI-like enzyme
MAARVIQGYFIGRGPIRDPGLVTPRPGRPIALVQAKTVTGRPALAFTPVGTGAGARGDGRIDVDPMRLGLARSGGAALPQALLAKMEGAFGADFSQVRVHVGPQAARIGAIAFTTGNDIYFAPGRYQPESVIGQQLLGHELAHVIQQRQGRVRASSAGVSIVQDRALEAEADRLGARAATHRTLQAKGLGRGSHVRVSEPIRDGDGSYRVRAEVAGRNVGSLRVHVDTGRSARVTDLGVDPGHRSQGIGKMLLASAARAGQRFGKSSVTLTADDNGSGKLNRWYGGLGFARAGNDARGRPRFEAQTGRVLAGAAQPKKGPGALRAPVPAAPRPGPPGLVVQRSVAAKPKQKAAVVSLSIGGVTYTGKSSGQYGHAEMEALRKFIVAQPSLGAAATIINAGGSTVSCLNQPVCGSCKRVLEALNFTAAADGTELSTKKSGGVGWYGNMKVEEFMEHMGLSAEYDQAKLDGAK